jgi:arylsulfatase A-like enzyme
LNARQRDRHLDWPARVVAPNGAPNVLLINPDDSDYGTPSTFDGAARPALDWIARNGLDR